MDTYPSVTILAFEHSMEMSIVMARDLFHAGALARAHAAPAAGTGSAEQQVVVATQDGRPVETFSGSACTPDRAIGEITRTELVIVSGVWGDIDQLLNDSTPTVAWINKQHAQGAIIACLHTGVFLLAETGLLDGHIATIYWRMVGPFTSRYPKIILQPEKSITSAGRLYCSAGVTSAVKMGIYLLEKIWGPNVAAKVSRHFLMDIPRAAPEFQLALDKQKQHTDTRIHAAQQWMEANFSSHFLLDEVADKVGLSLRSFRRRFKSATNDTPIQFLHSIRLETAKLLLTTSVFTVEQIGYRVGYEDANYFSRLFKRKLGVSPTEYRQQRRRQQNG